MKCWSSTQRSDACAVSDAPAHRLAARHRRTAARILGEPVAPGHGGSTPLSAGAGIPPAPAAVLRPASSHVLGPDGRRRRDEAGWVLGELRGALDLDVGERRLLKVHADRNARVTGQARLLAVSLPV
jgi:hypothetical protein